MLNINRVAITGRLTRDPETKYLPSGTAFCNIGVAVNDSRKNANGEWINNTIFLDVEAWGKTGERAAESLKKGQPVYIEGRLKMDTWERDGVKQSKIRVTADVVKPFEAPAKGEATDTPAAAPRQPKGNRGEYQQKPGPAASDNLDFGNDEEIPF